VTDTDYSGIAVAGPGFPRLALGSAWIASSAAVAAIGWLTSLNSGHDGAVLGRLLYGLAVVGLLAAGAVASNRHRAVTLRLAMAASAGYALAGGTAAILGAVGPSAMAVQLVVSAAALGVGSLLTLPLARRARAMSRPWP
jgi:hypothetical protein